MRSVQVIDIFVSLLIVKCSTVSRLSTRREARIVSLGHDSFVAITNELLIREREKERERERESVETSHSLSAMFAVNTLISELRNRQTCNWRAGCVELSQVSVGLARTSLGWINITLCLLKILELG